MNWASASGLADGLQTLLSSDEASALQTEFSTFVAEVAGHPVPSAGEGLWKSFCQEDHVPGTFKSAYQNACARILRRALANHYDKIQCGCTYHQSQFNSLRRTINQPGRHWLHTFFDVVAVCAPDAHAQLRCPDNLPLERDAPICLSHFFRLESFVQYYLTCADIAFALSELPKQLHPSLNPDVRLTSLRSGDFGRLKGRLGSYPHTRGSADIYESWCGRIKPFATYSAEITKAFNRHDAPDHVLRSLGLPFRANDHWIEIQYASAKVGIYHPIDNATNLAIPTFVDSAGNWIYWPNRDVPPRWNHARNLANNSRGQAEIIHELVDVARIDDAIVWALPTTKDWPTDKSPFLDGRAP